MPRPALRRPQRLRPQRRSACERRSARCPITSMSRRQVGNRSASCSRSLRRANILFKLKRTAIADRLNEDARRELLERIKHLEFLGYELEAAEGTSSFSSARPSARRQVLRAGQLLRSPPRWTTKPNLHLRHRHPQGPDAIHSATAHGHGRCTLSTSAFRSASRPVPRYPGRPPHRLQGPRARLQEGTAAKVRSSSSGPTTARAGLPSAFSDNVIEASWRAMLDAIASNSCAHRAG